MEVLIKIGTKTLNAYVVRAETGNTCILFLSGGSITVGKERYREWQENLKLAGMSSVSFNYSGISGSGVPLEKSSLQSRIEESIAISDWMNEHMQAEHYVLYGVSMGGYIALGLINEKPDMFEKLILHAPAAYSPLAHTDCFGEKFRQEIRKEDSWKNSFSFKWLGNYKNPILFIEAENEEIIPHEITENYKTLKIGHINFESFILKKAKHDVWNNTPQNTQFRDEIYERIKKFSMSLLPR